MNPARNKTRFLGPLASLRCRWVVVGVLLLSACGSSTSTTAEQAIPDRSLAIAPASCWKRLLRDAFDGSIDASFTPRCYRAALTHLPMDAYTPLHAVLESGVAQAVGVLVPPERSWASVRRRIRAGRAGARRTLASWEAWLAGDRLSANATRFAAPSRRWLLARLERLQTIYHFRLLGLRYLHGFESGSRPAPLLIVRADPDSFVRATRLVLASLDQQPRTNPRARVVWNYEAFYLEARDQFGAPFLAVFNNRRAPHPGGGQWASNPNLYPFPHG